MSDEESHSSSEEEIIICDYESKSRIGHSLVIRRVRCKERAKYLFQDAKGNFYNRCSKHCPHIIRTLY